MTELAPKTRGRVALAAAILCTAHASAQTLSFPGGSLSLPSLRLPRPKAPRLPAPTPDPAPPAPAGPTPTYAPTSADRAEELHRPAEVKKAELEAETAMRIVLYGLDDELRDKSDLVTGRYLMRETKACLADIAALRAAGSAQKLTLNGQDPMSLDEVERRFCRPALAQLEPVVGAAIAADEAKWAGVSKARVDFVKAHGLTSYTIYGHGKRVLASPAALQESDVWYVWDEDRGYAVAHWWMATIRWRGDSYVKTVEKGIGGQPPAALFR